jgi:hypothetical protein
MLFIFRWTIRIFEQQVELYAFKLNVDQIIHFFSISKPQRIGIKPDISVYPTVKGIQAGKDEVLERAIEFLKTGK